MGRSKITQRDVERRLGLGRVDDQELAWAISTALQQAQFTSELQIDYPSAESPILTLKYFKKGGLRAIIPGSHLTGEIVDQVEHLVTTALLAQSDPIVCRFPLFAHVPTEGFWRYRDKLVIRRAPDDAPRPGMIMGEHPLILEVSFNGSMDGHLRNMRARQEPRQLALLLSLFVPGIKVPSINSRKHWMLDVTPGVMRPVWAQETYFIPNLATYADSLSEQGNLPDIELVATMPYGVRADQVLVLPEDLEQKLDTFMQLDGTDRARLLRSAYWLHHSREVWDVSKSAHFQSTIQAVESLLEYPKDQQRCPTCRKKHEGPTALFRQFIDRYAPMQSENEQRSRKLLYDKRSKITHGASLINADEEAGLGWHSPKPAYEYKLSSDAQKVCTRAVIGWLDARSLEKSETVIQHPQANSRMIEAVVKICAKVKDFTLRVTRGFGSRSR